jgi:hypothetical protein
MPWINSFPASVAVRKLGNLGRDKPFFYFLFQKIEGGQNPEFSPAKRGEQKLMPPSFLKFGFSTG